MVDESGNARITDFGLATIARDTNSLMSTSSDQTQAIRWTAPEISTSNEAATKASDVFSLGMVIIEVGRNHSATYQSSYPLVQVFTGEVPFHRVKSAEIVMLIMRGQRPERPNHPKFTTPLWALTQRCWAGVAQDRPKMENVVKVLEELSVFYFCVYAMDILPACRHRSASQVPRTGKSYMVTGSPTTAVSRENTCGMPLETSTASGGTVPAPYLDTLELWVGSPPVPPPKDGRGITDERSSISPFSLTANLKPMGRQLPIRLKTTPIEGSSGILRDWGLREKSHRVRSSLHTEISRTDRVNRSSSCARRHATQPARDSDCWGPVR